MVSFLFPIFSFSYCVKRLSQAKPEMQSIPVRSRRLI
jgi:hypothetical protein